MCFLQIIINFFWYWHQQNWQDLFESQDYLSVSFAFFVIKRKNTYIDILSFSQVSY